jgi:hypothetical protein
MSSFSDLDEQIERLKRCEYLKESEVKTLCDKAREILLEESNVQLVDAPCTVSTYLAYRYINLEKINYRCFRSAVTFMVSSTTSSNCSRSEASALTLTMFSLAISSIGATTAWKPFCSCSR